MPLLLLPPPDPSNLTPAPQRKCEQYWPSEVQQEYSGFLVTVKSCRVTAFYTQRTFSVRDVRSRKVRAAGQSRRSTGQDLGTKFCRRPGCPVSIVKGSVSVLFGDLEEEIVTPSGCILNCSALSLSLACQ